MRFTKRINTAIKRSAQLHRDQVRKDKEYTPYITHLVSVAILLSSVTEDEDVIVAGLMHDSLEDVPHYTYDKLVEDEGERVAKIVYHVTEPLDPNKEQYDQLPWMTRKEEYLKRLREGEKESVLVSLADKIHNTMNYISSFNEEGEMFTKRFTGSVENTIWYLNEVIAIGKEKVGGDHVFVTQLYSLTKELGELIVRR
jgi:(p)ppGpp synthase/HD superfamily hydrolase